MKNLKNRKLLYIGNGKSVDSLKFANGGSLKDRFLDWGQGKIEDYLLDKHPEAYQEGDTARFNEILSEGYKFNYSQEEMETVQRLLDTKKIAYNTFDKTTDNIGTTLATSHAMAGTIGGVATGNPGVAALGTGLGQLKNTLVNLMDNKVNNILDDTLSPIENYMDDYATYQSDKSNIVQPKGYNVNTIFAKGGNINENSTRNLVPLSSDADIVKGAKHEQGGVQIGNAEVEGNEVLQDIDKDGKNDRVFSDRLKYKNGVTFADEAERLNKIKGKYETEPTGNTMQDTTNSRMITSIDMQLDTLFQEQQVMNEGSNGEAELGSGGWIPPSVLDEYNINMEDYIPNRELSKLSDEAKLFTDNYGSVNYDDLLNTDGNTNMVKPSTNTPSFRNRLDAIDKGELAANLLPMTDNLINANLIRKTPEVPKPILEKNINLETTYDINAPLQDIRGQADAFNKNIDNTTSSGGVANARKLSALSKSMGATSSLYNQKINTERSLRNKEKILNKEVASRNLEKVTGDYLMNLRRDAGILEDKAANAKNLTEDFKYIIDRKDINDYQKAQLLIDQKKYGGSTVYRGLVDIPEVSKLITTSVSFAQGMYDNLMTRGLPADIEAADKILKLNPNIKIKE